MLAEGVQWPEEIDVERAKRAEARARERLEQNETGIDIARAEAALKRAIARQNAVK